MSENSTNPFMGLQSYGPGESNKLFGRERDLILMKDRIFSARTTLLFAGSGVGKTSFLNAKIIPDLKDLYWTFYHSRWAGPAKPLEAVKATLAEQIEDADKQERLIDCFEPFLQRAPVRARPEDSDNGIPPQKQCLLIFDQFEEIFQYHAYEDYFKRFLNEVCEVIRRDDYRVHLVISMREEYLGELSVFDNLIPDLFNNYYRLRYPDKRDAAQIIEGTCRTAGKTVHRVKLNELIRDLSKIEKGVASSAERSTRDNKAVDRVVERSFIIPPYLQIVCHRHWEDQAKQSSNNGQNGFVFLENYEPNRAQKMLREFCEEKLATLTFMEQNVAERSFDFLVTKQGAKMAYEFTSLVEHMRLRLFKARLKNALTKLSAPETRILRKSHGPDGSVWFELYHDIYGKILDTWRASFRARKHRLALLLGIVGLVLLLILIPISWHWGISPYQSKKILRNAQLEKPEEYRNAFEAYNSLSQTLGYGSTADSLWADAWVRRAQYAESHNERDEAIISWLKAVEVKPDSPRADVWRLKAGNLIGDDYQRLNHRLYHENRVTETIFSGDGQLVVTKTDDERIWIWDTKTGALMGKHADPQTSVPAPAEPAPAEKTPQSGTVITVKPRGDTDAHVEPKTNTIHAAAFNKQLGWLVAVTFDDEQPARVIGGRRVIPREQYIPKPVLVLSKDDELVSSDIKAEQKWSEFGYSRPNVAITPDGTLIATTGRGQTTRVWKIEGGKAVAVEGFRSDRFVRNVRFSPDGKSLLMEDDKYRLLMFDVASGQLRYAPLSLAEDQFLFSSDGDSFAVLRYSPFTRLSIETRSTATGKPLGKVATLETTSFRFNAVALTADNTILLFGALGEVWSADPTSTEFRETIRLNAQENPISKLSPTGDLALSSGENEVRLHRIELQDMRNPMLNAGEKIANSVLTDDGRRIAALISKPDPKATPRRWNEPAETDRYRFQAWDANTLTPVGNSIEDVIVLSDNGEYVATIDPKKQTARRRKGNEIDDKGIPVHILNVRTGEQVMTFEYPYRQLFNRLISSPGGRFFATFAAETDSSWEYLSYYQRRFDPWAALTRPDSGYFHLWDRDEPSRAVDSDISITAATQYTWAFSHDDRFFAVSGNSSTGITVWNLEKKEQVQLTKNLAQAGALAFNKRGQLIGGAARRIRIWDLGTRQSLNEMDTLERITAVALAADGRTFLMGDANGVVSLLKFSSTNGPVTMIGEVRHRDPPTSAMLSIDETAGVISAGNWLHTTNVSDHRYVTSYFLGPTWSKQCRSMDNSGSQFRCLFQTPVGKLQIKDLRSGEIQDNVRINGEARSLFELWSRRLGLKIDNLGKIVPAELGGASSTAASTSSPTQQQ